MKRTLWAFFSLGLAMSCSCSSGSATPDAPANSKSIPGEAMGPCAPRSGSYLVHQEERPGGACGPQSDAVVVLQANALFGPRPNCKGAQSAAPDGCSISTDVSCPGVNTDGAPLQVTITGKVTWSEDGTHGAGTLQEAIALQSSGHSCSSIYDVSYTEQ